jgi:SAM-dependent methyltransferase
MADLTDPTLVSREYVELDRLSRRRLDQTGWLRDVGEPIETLLSAIAEARPGRVLDAGCGNGRIAALLATREVVCVDQSAAAVAAARALGLEAVQADIQALPFEDATFDVVMSNWTLYHLPDLDAGLSEIARVLRPGCRFVGAYNRQDHLRELWQAVQYEWPPDPFSSETGVEALRRHFTAVERRDTNGDVLWESRDALTSYLDAYSEMIGPIQAPEGPYPFRAARRNCVFVAHKNR